MRKNTHKMEHVFLNDFTHLNLLHQTIKKAFI